MILQYRFHDLVLAVTLERAGAELLHLLPDMSFERTAGQPAVFNLQVSAVTGPLQPPRGARPVFDSGGLYGFEDVAGVGYLTEGTSLLQVEGRTARAQMAPDFAGQPWLLRQQFWAFGLLKLMRPLGLYGLHAACVGQRSTHGLLLVGPSGSGKSTLAVGLIQRRWHYVTDDALLLSVQPQGVVGRALRRPFSLEAPSVGQAELPLGEAMSSHAGHSKRRFDVDAVFLQQRLPYCLPRMLLFPRIVPISSSSLRPLDHVQALQHLLAQSGPPLFDRATMAGHLEVLKQLMRQTAIYELCAGRDLHDDPGRLEHLLCKAEVDG